jgi:hypothetical protein
VKRAGDKMWLKWYSAFLASMRSGVQALVVKTKIKTTEKRKHLSIALCMCVQIYMHNKT